MKELPNWRTCQITPVVETVLKPAFEDVAPGLGIGYGMIIVAAVLLNSMCFIRILRCSATNHYVRFYLGVLNLLNLASCVLTLPLSYLLHVTFWRYGSLLCSIVPVLQKLLSHMTFLCLMCLALEQYRKVIRKAPEPLPYGVSMTIITAVSLCLAIPVVFFTDYYYHSPTSTDKVELESCTSNTKDMVKYDQAMFSIVYALPLVMCVALFARVSLHIRRQAKATGCRNRYVAQHEVMQKYLVLITSLTAVMWLPLNVLTLTEVQYPADVKEACILMGTIDLVYSALIWLAHLPTVITPMLATGLIQGQENLAEQLESDAHEQASFSSTILPTGRSSGTCQSMQTTEF